VPAYSVWQYEHVEESDRTEIGMTRQICGVYSERKEENCKAQRTVSNGTSKSGD